MTGNARVSKGVLRRDHTLRDTGLTGLLLEPDVIPQPMDEIAPGPAQPGSRSAGQRQRSPDTARASHRLAIGHLAGGPQLIHRAD